MSMRVEEDVLEDVEVSFNKTLTDLNWLPVADSVLAYGQADNHRWRVFLGRLRTIQLEFSKQLNEIVTDVFCDDREEKEPAGSLHQARKNFLCYYKSLAKIHESQADRLEHAVIPLLDKQTAVLKNCANDFEQLVHPLRVCSSQTMNTTAFVESRASALMTLQDAESTRLTTFHTALSILHGGDAERWLTLRNEASDIENKLSNVNISTDLLSYLPTNDSQGKEEHIVRSLTVTVTEAKELASVNNYYSVVMVDKISHARTSVRNKTLAPFWKETLEFENLPSDAEYLLVVLYAFSDSIQTDTEVGRLWLPFTSFQYNVAVENWYPLDRSEELSFDKTKTGGFIRLTVTLSREHVMTSAQYAPFMAEIEGPARPLFTQVMNDVVLSTDREALALALIKLAYARTADIPLLLVELAESEITACKDVNVLFRGNSLASKSIDWFMKIVGTKYLHTVLWPHIAYVEGSDLQCEIDPSRISDDDSDVSKNLQNLISILDNLWGSILESLPIVSQHLQFVFSRMRKLAEVHMGGDASYTVVSSLFFLRFVCPVILNPKLFKLSDDYPTGKAMRTYTLLAKVLQNLGNLTHFGQKEPYMIELNSWLREHDSEMRSFLNDISNSLDIPPPLSNLAALGSIDVNYTIAHVLRILTNSESNLKKFAENSKNPEQVNKAQRLINHIDASKLIQTLVTPTSSASTPASRDSLKGSVDCESRHKNEQFRVLFGLPFSEKVLQEFSCVWERKIPLHGKLFVSTKCFAFHAKVFGLKATEVLPILNITDIELCHSKDMSEGGPLNAILFKLDNDKKSCLFYFKERSCAEEYSSILTHWQDQSKMLRDRATISDKLKDLEDDQSHITLVRKNSIQHSSVGRSSLISSARGTLDEADLNVFLMHAELRTYQHDEVVIHAGEHNCSLYQIACGSVRVVAPVSGTGGPPQILGRIDSGDFFGEIEFLSGPSAVACTDVISDVDDLEIYVIDHSVLAPLLDKLPRFTARFYCFLAKMLSMRITSQNDLSTNVEAHRRKLQVHKRSDSAPSRYVRTRSDSAVEATNVIPTKPRQRKSSIRKILKM